MARKVPASKKHNDRVADQQARASLPLGTPYGITPEDIRETQRVWQPYFRELVTDEMAIEMMENMRRLADVLYPDGPPSWVRNYQREPTPPPVSAPSPDGTGA